MNLKKKLMAFAVSMGAMMLVVSPLPVRAAEVDSQSYSVLETEIESNEVYMDTTSDEQGKMAGSAESTVPADTEEIASGEVQESQTETADSETADSETADSETADSETADSETAESDETDETDETVQEGIVTDADGSIYYYENGEKFTGGYKEIADEDGNTVYYYFQKDGRAYTNGLLELTDDEGTITYYYFQSNGQAYTKGYLKFVHTNKKTYIYYFQTNGRAFTGGWKNAGGKRYYFDTQGHGYTGWKKVNNKTCYFNADGEAQRGWSKVKGSWYYFDLNSCEKMFESSVLHNAWLKINSRSSSTDYYIVVDRDNTRTMIFKGSKGHWIPIYDWKCSVGAPSTPTVTGTFTVGAKGYSFGDGYTCYYYTQFYGDYLFHSVLYHEGTFNVRNGRLGAHISHGCIRLKIENAKWIYDNIPSKTKVYIY